MRLARDVGIAIVGALVGGLVGSFATHGRAVLWIALAVALIALCATLLVERWLAARNIAYGIRPGSLVVNLRISASTRRAMFDVRLPLRNVTKCAIRYRMIMFTVAVGDVRSPLIKPFEGVVPPINGIGDFVRDPIEVPKVPIDSLDQPVEVTVHWRLYYGPERKRRFVYRRTVGSVYTMGLSPLTKSPHTAGDVIQAEQAVRFSEECPDRALRRRERKGAQ